MTRTHLNKTPGFNLVELLIVLAAIAILTIICLFALVRLGHTQDKIACAANLSSIGKAIATYASKYGGHYPTIYQYAKPPAGSPIPDFTASQKWADDARGYKIGSVTASDELPDWKGGSATAPGDPASAQKGPFTCNLSCLFLLVRTGDAFNAGIFLCQGDFNEGGDTASDDNFQKFCSFHFITNCSYSFQNQIYDNIPYNNGGGQNTNQNTLDPRIVVAADMNPSRYYDAAQPPSVFSSRARAGVCTWNSPNHNYQGQNCLYGDGHVVFNDNPWCAYGSSNLWTRGSYNAGTGTGNASTGSWSNADPSGGGTITGSPPSWDAPYGSTPVSGGNGCGTGDKYNSFLVP